MTHTLWTIPQVDVVTPVVARSLIEECFYQAQAETFARAKSRVGTDAQTPEAIRKAVVGAVRAAFREAGGNYDRPDLATLRTVVGVLARKAAAWGTPEDVIQHHGRQIKELLARMR